MDIIAYDFHHLAAIDAVAVDDDVDSDDNDDDGGGVQNKTIRIKFIRVQIDTHNELSFTRFTVRFQELYKNEMGSLSQKPLIKFSFITDHSNQRE